LDINIGKVRLKENFDYFLFDDDLYAGITKSIEGRNILILEFTDVSLVDKVFSLEIVVGDDVYGFVTKVVDFKTLCEEGKAGDDCTETACWDVAASDKDFVCDGKGTCDAANHCVCDGVYKGEQCEYGYTSDEVQMAKIILEDPIVNSWEKLIVSSEVKLPDGAPLDTKVFYKWSLVGERDLFASAILTPEFQKEIAFSPYSFKPDSIHVLKLEVRTNLGVVTVEKVFHIVPELPAEYIQVTKVEGEVNTFDVDVSRYLFTDKIMTYSVVDPESGVERILLRTNDPIVRIVIPSKEEGVVTLRTTVYHFPSKKEVIRDEQVEVVKSSFIEADVVDYINERDLFGESWSDNKFFLREVAYLIAWLNEFPSFSLVKMEDYRTEIFNALVLYSSKVQLDEIDEYLIILNGLTENIKSFPAPGRVTLFEVTFGQVVDEFIFLLEGHDFDNIKVEKTLHDSYFNLLYCLLVLRKRYSTQGDVNSVLEAYDSLIGTYLRNKIDGEITSFESKQFSYFSVFSTEQELEILESQEIQVAGNVFLSFPIYPQNTETKAIQIKTMVFDENPYNAGNQNAVSGIETSPTIRIKIEGKSKSEFYIIRLEGKFKNTAFKYYDVNTQEWVKIDTKIREQYHARRQELEESQIYFVKRRADSVTFESNMDNVAFVYVDETNYAAIIAVSVVFGALGILLCVAIVVAVVVTVIICAVKNKKEKSEEEEFSRFDQEEQEGKRDYDERMKKENIKEGTVAGALKQFD
jgi:hypothetical protein